MLHALPAKPAFLGPPPTTSTLPSLPIASSSKSNSSVPPIPTQPVPPSDPSKCTLCAQPPKYTCPRCSRRTCSLPCSTSHKAKYSCSGIRDPGSFVPLKTYGQGEWAEDYRWLEEGRRRVEGWGKGVKEEEVDRATSGPVRGRVGVSRGGVDSRGRGKKSKTHALQLELRSRGVWAEFMPEGMGRRRLNQSTWNAKSGILSLTIQLSIPQDLLPAESSTQALPDAPSIPSETLDHTLDPLSDASTGKTEAGKEESASRSIQSGPKLILNPRVLLVHPSHPLPTLTSLLPALIPPSPDLVFLMPFHPSPARPTPPSSPSLPRAKLFFPPLNPDIPIAEIIKGTAWVEFPTIHVMAKKEWEEGLREGKYGMVELAQPRKRGLEIEEGQGEMGRTSRWNWTGRGASEGELKESGKGGGVKRIKADEALGALGEYMSDEEDEAEGEVGDGDVEEQGGDDGLGDKEEEDFVLDHQPGSLLAGLPPDLLVAMSHAINTDLS